MSEYAIKFDGVTKSFGEFKAVDGLDLSVIKGQIYGLIGPDGAGKTTSIRIMATLMRPMKGTAKVLDLDVAKDALAIRRRIGYMPQNFSLYRDLTVMENVAFYAGIYHVPDAEMKKRVEGLLDFTGLGPFTERVAEALSGGMKQKLALACALIHEPELVLLDEPTIGVDPVARRQFWRILDGLVARGTSVLVSTPYMDEAERCHRVAFMSGGKVVREGEVEDVRRAKGWKLYSVRGPRLRDVMDDVAKISGVRNVKLLGDALRVKTQETTEASFLTSKLGALGEYRVEEIRPSLEDAFSENM